MENQIVNLLGGVLLSLAMQGAKKAQSIPVNEGQKTKIRAILSVLSLVVGFGNAFLSGGLADESLIKPLVDSAITFAVTQLSYLAAFKKKEIVQ